MVVSAATFAAALSAAATATFAATALLSTSESEVDVFPFSSAQDLLEQVEVELADKDTLVENPCTQ